MSLKHPSLATEGSSAEQLLINAVCWPEINIDRDIKHTTKKYKKKNPKKHYNPPSPPPKKNQPKTHVQKPKACVQRFELFIYSEISNKESFLTYY